MDKLTEYLITFVDVEREAINAARLAHPGSGLLEALRQTLPDVEYQNALRGVIKGGKIPFLSDRELYAADERLCSNASPELARLVERLGALPLAWSETRGQRVLKIALTDPFANYPGAVISAYFKADIEPYLAEEGTIRAGLLQKLGTGSKPETASSIHKALGQRELFPGETEAGVQALEELLSSLVKRRAHSADIEFLPASVRVQMHHPRNRSTAKEITVSPPELVRALLNRCERAPSTESLFDGIVRLELGRSIITCRAVYYRFYGTASTTRWNSLQLSDIQVSSADREPLWTSRPEAVVDRLGQLMDNTPGYYAAAVQDISSYRALVSSLLRRYPEMYIADNAAAAFENALFREHARYSKVLVPLKANDVPNALVAMDGWSTEHRGLLKAILSFGRVPRSCPFCIELCAPSSSALSLLPRELTANASGFPYPCGCQICAGKGYVGTVSAVSVLRLDCDAGKRFQEGAPVKEVYQQLPGSGFVSHAQSFLESALRGETTLEVVLRLIFGKQDIEFQDALAVGKQSLADGRVLGPLTEAPLQMRPKQDKEAGFHSVVLKLDDKLQSTRDALLREMKAPQPPVQHLPNGAAPGPRHKPATSTKYHSVVLELDNESMNLREALLREQEKLKS